MISAVTHAQKLVVLKRILYRHKQNFSFSLQTPSGECQPSLASCQIHKPPAQGSWFPQTQMPSEDAPLWACSLTPGVCGDKRRGKCSSHAELSGPECVWRGSPGSIVHTAPCPEPQAQQPHHSNSITKLLSRDVLGDKGTAFLQEKDGLQGLSCAVGNNPARIQCAEGEATLQSVGPVMARADGRARTLVVRTSQGESTLFPSAGAQPPEVQLQLHPHTRGQASQPTVRRHTHCVHAPTHPEELPSTLCSTTSP